MSVHPELWNCRTATEAIVRHLPAELTPVTLAPFVCAACCCACVRQHVWICLLCVNLCFVRELLPAHAHTFTHTYTFADISPSSLTLWEKTLYRLEKGVLKARHITWLCTTSDSNHTWPRSTAPIILWICYGVLMLTAYPGFIIMTAVPRKGSASSSSRLRRQTNQITMRRQLADSSSWPRSRSSPIFKNMKMCVRPLLVMTTFKVFLFVGRPDRGGVSRRLFVRRLQRRSLLCPGLIRALRWQYDHFISVDHCFSTSQSMGCNGPPAAWHSSITFHCVRALQ